MCTHIQEESVAALAPKHILIHTIFDRCGTFKQCIYYFSHLIFRFHFKNLINRRRLWFLFVFLHPGSALVRTVLVQTVTDSLHDIDEVLMRVLSDQLSHWDVFLSQCLEPHDSDLVCEVGTGLDCLSTMIRLRLDYVVCVYTVCGYSL